MEYRAVILDLDGTLLDTLADIAAAANRTLVAHGYPVHALAAYRRFVGDGTASLIERALPPDQRTAENINACLQMHLKDYNANWAVATRPYDGIQDLFRLLSSRCIPSAVVTNKPHDAALLTLNHFFPGTDFNRISGIRPGVEKKPDPTEALAAAMAMGVSPAQCLFLGDSDVDMQTACNAGMIPIGAGWGYRTATELKRAGARCILNHPLELTAMGTE